MPTTEHSFKRPPLARSPPPSSKFPAGFSPPNFLFPPSPHSSLDIPTTACAPISGGNGAAEGVVFSRGYLKTERGIFSYLQWGDEKIASRDAAIGEALSKKDKENECSCALGKGDVLEGGKGGSGCKCFENAGKGLVVPSGDFSKSGDGWIDPNDIFDDTFTVQKYSKKDKDGNIFANQDASQTNQTNDSSDIQNNANGRPIFVFVHGAGVSAWSFHLVACELNRLSKCPRHSRLSAGSSSFIQSADTQLGTSPRAPLRSFAFDMRCHGSSCCDGGAESLTIDTLVADARAVIECAVRCLYTSTALEGTEHVSAPFEFVPHIYLAGHSLGGAVITNLLYGMTAKRTEDDKESCNLAVEGVEPLNINFSAAIVLDVVEETAVQSLKHMPAFLSRRPNTFSEVRTAVNWFLNGGGMKSTDSAHITVPSLLVAHPPCADKDAKDRRLLFPCPTAQPRPGLAALSVAAGGGRTPGAASLCWRTDLAVTLPCWQGWFKDLDKRFLAMTNPMNGGQRLQKVLIIANCDRLDKDLTVAQMQGKFQFEVVGHDSGHYVHEDAPEAVATILCDLEARMESLKQRLALINSRKSY